MSVSGLVLLLYFPFTLSNGLPKNTYILYRDCQVPLNSDPLLNYQNTKHLRIDDLTGGIVLYSHEGAIQMNKSNTHDLRFNNTGNSPESSLPAYSSYPHGFSCEVVVHTPVENAKIMMRVDSFYIPSSSDDCVENYLYVFDSNTAKSKAMPEAGGERGLCRSSYPRLPIYTTKSYICIAFHTSQHWPTQSSGVRPGFRLVLTAIRETTTATCQPGGFYCGPRTPPLQPTQTSRAAHSMLLGTTRPLLYATGDSGTGALVLSSGSSAKALHMSSGDVQRLAKSAVRSSGKQPSYQQTPVTGFCVSEQTVCDGVLNCADGRDEIPSRCLAGQDQRNPKQASATSEWPAVSSKKSGWLSRFLSLGVPASIAIAVCTIIIFTVFIGIVVCCCHRCCSLNHPSLSSSWAVARATTNRMHSSNSSSQQASHYRQQLHQQSVPMAGNRQLNSSEAWNAPRNTGNDGRTDINQPSHNWPSLAVAGSYPSNFPPVSTGGRLVDYGQLDPANHFFHPLGTKPGIDVNKTSNIAGYGSHHFLPFDFPPGGGGGGLSISASESLVSSEHYSGLRGGGVGGPCSYTYYPAPPGPPPALLPSHGLINGSPTMAIRRDPIGLEMCCYTPPPYGGCTVPPASSVTASSSRTGTTSGHNCNDWSNSSRALPTAQPIGDPNLEPDGGTASHCIPLAHNPHHQYHHHHHHRRTQQLSGSAQSALHTNTPVEVISQTGANDLTTNGGILYLGEVFHDQHSSSSTSCSDQLNPLRRPPPGAPNSSTNTTNTTPTTGSGGSSSRRIQSRRYHTRRPFLPSSRSVRYFQLDSRSLPSGVAEPTIARSGRSRVSSRRHHQLNQHHYRRSSSTSQPHDRAQHFGSGSSPSHSISPLSNLAAQTCTSEHPPVSVLGGGAPNTVDRQEPVSFPVRL